MGEEKIKSALEIAMEKVAKMPKLTPQEIREQKEREYRPRGEVIANRYLVNALRGTDLEIELGKYQGEEAQIVRKAFLSTMCHSIQLDDADKSRRAIDGVRASGIHIDLGEIRQEFEEISSAFNRAQEKTCQTLEASQKKILLGLGISGSAVRPNVKENEDWQNELHKMRLPYDLRIDKLKERLLRDVES